MLSKTKKSSHRLSSLFSLGDKDKENDGTTSSGTPQPAASSDHLHPDSRGRVSSAPPARTTKERVSSGQLLAPNYPPPTPAIVASQSQPTITPVEDLQPPPPLSSLSIPGSRSSSPNRSQPSSRPSSRPGTPVLDAAGNLAPPEGGRRLKRKSWLFGGARSSDEAVVEPSGVGPPAWVVGHHGKVTYSLSLLLNGEKVPELWDDEGDTFVYLFPRTSGKGASFRIDSSVYAASPELTRIAFGHLYSDSTVAASRRQELPDHTSRHISGGFSNSSRTASPEPSVPDVGSSDGSKGSRTFSDATEDVRSEVHLFVPLKLSTDGIVSHGGAEPKLNSGDVENLVAYRNFFSFLIGQSLVATEKNPHLFDIFLRIAALLETYRFSNVDGSSFGEVAALSFDNYVDELHLADIRASREKTIEAIVLGEKMRSVMLYTEGFVHGVGKYEDIQELRSPKFAMISHKTANRMARASMDLELRIRTLNMKLEEFDFPAIFSGLMNSKTAEESKIIKFEAWRESFMTMRKSVLAFYKAKYGSWTPKASNKKNSLSTSGLNRRVVLDVYYDFSSLYDLLVDRHNITTRSAEGPEEEDEGNDFATVMTRALRRVMSEYDRSTPPVLPPMPFDLPRYPDLHHVRKDYPSSDVKKDAKARSKKLHGEEAGTVLKLAKNMDSDIDTPFLNHFRDLERKEAKSKTLDDLWNLRCGQWMFVYAVLQALPMLAVDAPGVRFTDGVEYFLCEPPKSGVPWAREESGAQRTWYSVAGSKGVVSLPADIVEYGVEGVYRRSHAWEMAAKWTEDNPLLHAAVQESTTEPLPPRNLLAPPENRSRSQSPSGRRQSAMKLGLEALPLPAGVAPSTPALRPKSSNDPNKTFDAILQSADIASQGGKKKR